MIPRIDQTNDLWTCAALCQQFQQSPGLIQQGLDTLGVAPSLSLNGKAYYAMTDEVTQLLHEWLRMRRSNSGNAAWTADVDIPANYKPMG